MKTKFRLQMMIGLLFIAITISVIAVSVGWYSASGGEIDFQEDSVTVTSAANSYEINVSYELEGPIVWQNDQYILSTVAKSYLGEDGLNDKYMLLYQIEGEEAITINAYVSKCTTSIADTNENNVFEYTSETTEFDIFFVENIDDSWEVSDEVTNYIVIVFGNGNDTFDFSDPHYMGTTFKLEVSIG